MAEGYPLLRVKALQSLMGNYAVSGFAIITMQSIIYDRFYWAIGDGPLPGPTYEADWTIAYTTIILLSGIMNVLMSGFLFCLMRKRRTFMMCMGIVLNLAVGALAGVACCLAILEMQRLYDPNEGHPCSEEGDPYGKTCSTWWWFELFVTIFSVNAGLTALGVIGVIFLGCCCGGR